jgi:hypothetical protein
MEIRILAGRSLRCLTAVTHIKSVIILAKGGFVMLYKQTQEKLERQYAELHDPNPWINRVKRQDTRDRLEWLKQHGYINNYNLIRYVKNVQ